MERTGEAEPAGRLAAGRWALATLATAAALEAWVEIAAPRTTGPGWLSAVAWAATEHPGRCALGVSLGAWALWSPSGGPSGGSSGGHAAPLRADPGPTDPAEGRSHGL